MLVYLLYHIVVCFSLFVDIYVCWFTIIFKKIVRYLFLYVFLAILGNRIPNQPGPHIDGIIWSINSLSLTDDQCVKEPEIHIDTHFMYLVCRYFLFWVVHSLFSTFIYGSHCGCNYQEISTSILLDLCQQVRHPIINSPFLCQHITHIYTYTQIYLLIYMLVHITLSFCKDEREQVIAWAEIC